MFPLPFGSKAFVRKLRFNLVCFFCRRSINTSASDQFLSILLQSIVSVSIKELLFGREAARKQRSNNICSRDVIGLWVAWLAV